MPGIESLNLPEAVFDFANLPMGLILVTGQTGSGKSTTLAAIVDYINHKYPYHVITLEDPIEYYLKSDICSIEQREVGIDVPDFASGLRHVLRQDPDVILIGEMRDLETIATALTAAETGHLVLSTLHTNDSVSTIERIIDIVPGGPAGPGPVDAGQRPQGRRSASGCSRGSTSPGMVPAVEVLVSTPAVRNCIRENRIFEIPNVIETNRSHRHAAVRRVAEAAVLQRHDHPRRRHRERQVARQVAKALSD